MLSFFFFFFLNDKGLDCMVLTSSCSPTPVLGVHGINKKSDFLGLKNRFHPGFQFSAVSKWTLYITKVEQKANVSMEQKQYFFQDSCALS